MFTGIIEEVGDVISCASEDSVHRLVVRASSTPRELPIGGSVAVNGCCLTATSVREDRMSFDLAPETIARTRFDLRLVPGAKVNLERPLRMSSRLDGHFVQGHVDGVAVVQAIHALDSSAEVAFDLPAGLARYCVEKGSVAIDGVSLTCARVEDARVTVALIPHTQRITTLGALRVGDPVNVEVDMIAKYVEKLVPK